MKHQLLPALLLAFTLTACGALSGSPATALPTVILDGNGAPVQGQVTQAPSQGFQGNGDAVVASGIVLPAREAHLAFTLAGRINTVNVSLGDQVQAGQALAELDNLAVRAEFNRAQRDLKEMTSPAAVAAAEQAVAVARQGLKDTQTKTESLLLPRASDTLIDNTQAEIDLAQQQLARASDAYKPFARLPDGDTKKAAALVAMTSAQLQLNRLIAQYNWYSGTPSDIDAALAGANLAAAKAALQEAQWYLSAVKDEQIPRDATGSGLARLAQARDALAAAQEKLDGTRLIAPFAGTVAVLDANVGDFASPGFSLAIVGDVTGFRVETSDLSERDVVRVRVDQAVTVQVKALSASAGGHVIAIAPLADTLGGDVVYKTIIALDDVPDGLRAGMSVDVRFETGP